MAALTAGYRLTGTARSFLRFSVRAPWQEYLLNRWTLEVWIQIHILWLQVVITISDICVNIQHDHTFCSISYQRGNSRLLVSCPLIGYIVTGYGYWLQVAILPQCNISPRFGLRMLKLTRLRLKKKKKKEEKDSSSTHELRAPRQHLC